MQLPHGGEEAKNEPSHRFKVQYDVERSFKTGKLTPRGGEGERKCVRERDLGTYRERGREREGRGVHSLLVFWKQRIRAFPSKVWMRLVRVVHAFAHTHRAHTEFLCFESTSQDNWCSTPGAGTSCGQCIAWCRS